MLLEQSRLRLRSVAGTLSEVRETYDLVFKGRMLADISRDIYMGLWNDFSRDGTIVRKFVRDVRDSALKLERVTKSHCDDEYQSDIEELNSLINVMRERANDLNTLLVPSGSSK